MKRLSTYPRQKMFILALFCTTLNAADIPKVPNSLESNPALDKLMTEILQRQGSRYCDVFNKLYSREDLSEQCKLRMRRELQAVSLMCGSDGTFKGSSVYKNTEKALFDFTYMQKATTVLNADLRHCGYNSGQILSKGHRDAAISSLQIFKASVLSKQLGMDNSKLSNVSLEWSRYVDATWTFYNRCLMQLNTNIQWNELSQEQILELEKNEKVQKSLAVVCDPSSGDFTPSFQKYRSFEYKMNKLHAQYEKTKDRAESQGLRDDMSILEREWPVFGYKNEIQTAILIIQQVHSQMFKK